MICKKCSAELPTGAAYCHICGRKQARDPVRRIKRPNGSGTVYRLPGRRRRPWVAAKSGVVIGYYDTKTAALEAVNALAHRPITERYNMTFAEIYAAWKAERFRELTDKGREGYELSYKHFSALHDTQFRSLRAEHYQKAVDAHTDKGRSRSSADKMKQLAGQLSKWAMREEIIPTNYAQFIKLPQEQKTEKEIFSAADIKKLKASPNDAAKIVLMLIYTGMRIGELFDLKTVNVFDSYCIGGEKTEAGRNRAIPIPEDVRGYFDYFRQRTSGLLLIDGYDGNREIRNFRNRDYYELLDDLCITKKSPHCTRHTYASMAVSAGMKPEHLKKILGHASYNTTSDVYVHADTDLLVDAVKCLNAKKSKKSAVANALLTNKK